LFSDPNLLLTCIQSGARDLGGIGPRDEVNPDYPHSEVQALAHLLDQAGWQLARRLPVYPHYEGWLPERLQAAVKAKQVLSVRLS
jgi:FO synthase subunit 1